MDMTKSIFYVFNLYKNDPDLLSGFAPEYRHPWEAKQYGRPDRGGDTMASKESSPRLKKTRHGFKKKG